MHLPALSIGPCGQTKAGERETIYKQLIIVPHPLKSEQLGRELCDTFNYFPITHSPDIYY